MLYFHNDSGLGMSW